MSAQGPHAQAGDFEHLSALMDGEVSPEEAERICRIWHSEPAARVRWHAWHVTGDALRSDELLVDVGGDADFLARLRTQLAVEPVVLAPATDRAAPGIRPTIGLQPAADSTQRWRQWGAPAAVAAGFMLVVAAVVTLPGAQRDEGETVAAERMQVRTALAPIAVASGGGGAATALNAGLNASGVAHSLDASHTLIRDADLERYLAAHQQFSGGGALGGSVGFVQVGGREAGR